MEYKELDLVESWQTFKCIYVTWTDLGYQRNFHKKMQNIMLVLLESKKEKKLGKYIFSHLFTHFVTKGLPECRISSFGHFQSNQYYFSPRNENVLTLLLTVKYIGPVVL